MITPVLTLSPEAVEEDSVFRHPYLVRRDYALVGEQDWLPLPEFAICHTPLPADFCTCGRYALFEMAREEDWIDQGPPRLHPEPQWSARHAPAPAAGRRPATARPRLPGC